MPKAAKDTLLLATTRPWPKVLEREYANNRDQLKQTVADRIWHVDIQGNAASPQPDPPGGTAPVPAPYVQVSFLIAQHDSGALTVIRWTITGDSEVRLGEGSRFPLRTYARAAIRAVADTLDAASGLTPDQLATHGNPSTFDIVAGRLTDPRTHQPLTNPQRTYAHSRNGAGQVELHRVVDEYRKAIERGSRSPTADVAHAFNVGRSTAARSLTEARRQGLLGPALRNRAGELRDPPAQ